MKNNSDVIRTNDDFGLVDSICSENIFNISKDILEAGLDSIWVEGLVKDVPVLNIIHSIAKVGLNIRDRLFYKKVVVFLFHLKEVPIEQRIDIVKRINEEKKFRYKLGETLITIIDKSDELEKVELISKLFKVLVEQKISYEQFLRASSSINACYIDDIKWMFHSYHKYTSGNEHTFGLLNAGIIHLKSDVRKVQILRDFSETHLQFELSPTGEIIMKFLSFNEDNSNETDY